MKNKIEEYFISEEFLKLQLKRMGESVFSDIYIFDNRGSGKSTSLAFSTISLAMKNPGKVIQIIDHNNHPLSHSHLVDIIHRMLITLKLDGFKICGLKKTIMFNIYETPPEEVLKKDCA
jgi:hypothetical protein